METKLPFGPEVWCSIIVVESMRSVPLAATTEPSFPLAAAGEPSAALPGNSGVDVGLSTEDLFAFVKTLEMTAAKKPGALAVPTNTPLG